MAVRVVIRKKTHKYGPKRRRSNFRRTSIKCTFPSPKINFIDSSSLREPRTIPISTPRQRTYFGNQHYGSFRSLFAEPLLISKREKKFQLRNAVPHACGLTQDLGGLKQIENFIAKLPGRGFVMMRREKEPQHHCVDDDRYFGSYWDVWVICAGNGPFTRRQYEVVAVSLILTRDTL